jgi:hypothetical protein
MKMTLLTSLICTNHLLLVNLHEVNADNAMGIQPFVDNPYYWQYKQQPVVLLRASNHDNLYQATDMIEQLNDLVRADGNYILPTTSPEWGTGLRCFRLSNFK